MDAEFDCDVEDWTTCAGDGYGGTFLGRGRPPHWGHWAVSIATPPPPQRPPLLPPISHEAARCVDGGSVVGVAAMPLGAVAGGQPCFTARGHELARARR
eukprot:366337-Chlamydomonas_euryale.AAC.5